MLTVLVKTLNLIVDDARGGFQYEVYSGYDRAQTKHLRSPLLMAPKRVLSRHPETSGILRARKTKAVFLRALFHLASDGLHQLVGGLCTSTLS